MATASAPAAAPSAPRAPRARRILPPTLTVVGVAVLLKLIYGPWYLNYDARYALLWARDLLHGFSPDYTADFAPTPHPLRRRSRGSPVPFGDGARAMLW